MANLNLKFPNISETEKAIIRAYRSTMAFGKLFLPDFRKSVNPKAHYITMKEFDSLDNKPIALIATRDYAKTTLTKAYILRKLTFAKKAKEWGLGPLRTEHIGWVSSSQRKSQNNTQYIKDMLEFNPDLIQIFGKLKGRRWTAEDITTIYDDRMISASNLTSLRGDTMASVMTGAERYSGIIADDAENEQNTITDNAREKFSLTITNALMPAIEQGQLGNKFIFINTPVHYAGFTQDKIEQYFKIKDDPALMKDFAWKILFFPAILPDGSLVWPDRLTHEYLEKRKREIAASPMGVNGFYQEYMLQVQNEEDAELGRKVIRYHDAEYIWLENQNYIRVDGVLKPVNIFIGCDPATDIKTKRSDFSVIIVIAVDENNRIYVLHYERHKSISTSGQRNDNDELIGKKGVIDYIIDLYNHYHAKSAAVEDVAMTRSVFNDLNYRRDKLNRWDIIVIPYKPSTRDNKINRIITVVGERFKTGRVYIRKNHFELEHEIITFGARMSHDDTIDALHIAIKHAYPYRGNARGVIKKTQKRKAKSWQI